MIFTLLPFQDKSIPWAFSPVGSLSLELWFPVAPNSSAGPVGEYCRVAWTVLSGEGEQLSPESRGAQASALGSSAR
ncbi:MAG: hypothetical protein ACI30I_00015 [Parabacteroides sp.]